MKIINILFLCFTLSFAQAQTVAVETARHNAIYAGFNHYLTIAVENIDCEQLWVSTDNGVIKREEKDCSYRYSPRQVGRGKVLIYKVTKKDTTLLREKVYHIKPLKSEARLNNKKDGEMPLGHFKAQQGISAPIVNMEISASCKVVRFRMQIIREGEVITTCGNTGGRFTAGTRANFTMLKKGDIVFFDQIMTRCPGVSVPSTTNNIRIQLK